MSLKNIVCCLVLMLLASAAFGQKDTTYYDKVWNVSTRAMAKTYTTRLPSAANMYKVESRYMKNNMLQMTGTFASRETDSKSGLFTFYDEAGNVSNTGVYVNNLKDGEWKTYYDGTKTLWFTEVYNVGTVKELKSYYKSGKLKRTEKHMGESVAGKCYDEQGKEIVFTPFIIMPQPGFSIPEHLGANTHYPEAAIKKDIEGRVIVKFVVNEDGHLSEINSITKIGGGCDEEAVRVVSLMPRWKPGIQDDKPIKVWYTQPVSFKLED